MKSMRLVVLLLAAAACGRADSSRDSVALQDSLPDTGQPWVAELGPLLIVPSDNERVGVAIRSPQPDTGTLGLQLLQLGASFGRPVAATLEADSVSCGDAPLVRFRTPVPAGWTMGMSLNGAQPAPIDSIEVLSPEDSSALAADVARAASGVAPPESRFAGLPFVVLKAYRVTDGARTSIFANVLRRLPQEAAPLEAHMFLIAERTSDGRVAPQYSVRSEGTEDSAEHVTLLAVLRVEGRELAVVEREKADGTQYDIVERTSDGSWRVRWSRSC